MLISFAWTTGVLLQGRKTVTRRYHWTPGYFAKWQEAWDRGQRRHDAYDKLPRNGGKRVGYIDLTCRPYLEPLCDMPESDLDAEGGLWTDKADFIGDSDPRRPIPVIRFRFVPESKP